jgi:hypothetical protein
MLAKKYQYVAMAGLVVLLAGCSEGGSASSVSGNATGGNAGNVSVTTSPELSGAFTGEGTSTYNGQAAGQPKAATTTSTQSKSGTSSDTATKPAPSSSGTTQ